MKTDIQQILSVVDDKNLQSIRLHLGCGGILLSDYINIDYYRQDVPHEDSSRLSDLADLYLDIRAMELPDSSIDEFFHSHVLEHFHRWEALVLFEKWFRALKSGGQLIIETPDFWRCVLYLFHPSGEKRSRARRMFYGNQWDGLEYEAHRYLWDSREIISTLTQTGFGNVQVSHSTLTHHQGRDMRVVATKSLHS